MAYDLGDTVTDMWGEVRDAAGALTAAATAALTVYLPDGTTVSPSVSNPSTGVYGADYVPAVDGPFRWWLRTTGPATAKTGSFYVNPVIEPSIISLADAKQQLNMTRNASDEELRQVIQAATAAVESHLKKAVVRSTRIDYLHAQAGQAICLTWTPVLSVTSITTADLATTWATADIVINPVAGIVRAVSGATIWSGDLIATYVAGMTSIPPNYREAGEIIAQQLWDVKRGSKGAPKFGGSEDAMVTIEGMSYSIPRRALELLGPTPPMVA